MVTDTSGFVFATTAVVRTALAASATREAEAASIRNARSLQSPGKAQRKSDPSEQEPHRTAPAGYARP